jgi:hypothetical protein
MTYEVTLEALSRLVRASTLEPEDLQPAVSFAEAALREAETRKREVKQKRHVKITDAADAVVRQMPNTPYELMKTIARVRREFGISSKHIYAELQRRRIAKGK